MINGTGLDFEKPILELERKIEELKKFSSSQKLDIGSEVKRLEEKLEKVKEKSSVTLRRGRGSR